MFFLCLSWISNEMYVCVGWGSVMSCAYMAGNGNVNDTKQKRVGMKVETDDKRDDCSLIICILVTISMFGTFPLSSQKQLESWLKRIWSNDCACMKFHGRHSKNIHYESDPIEDGTDDLYWLKNQLKNCQSYKICQYPFLDFFKFHEILPYTFSSENGRHSFIYTVTNEVLFISLQLWIGKKPCDCTGITSRVWGRHNSGSSMLIFQVEAIFRDFKIVI